MPRVHARPAGLQGCSASARPRPSGFQEQVQDRILRGGRRAQSGPGEAVTPRACHKDGQGPPNNSRRSNRHAHVRIHAQAGQRRPAVRLADERRWPAGCRDFGSLAGSIGRPSRAAVSARRKSCGGPPARSAQSLRSAPSGETRDRRRCRGAVHAAARSIAAAGNDQAEAGGGEIFASPDTAGRRHRHGSLACVAFGGRPGHRPVRGRRSCRHRLDHEGAGTGQSQGVRPHSWWEIPT